MAVGRPIKPAALLSSAAPHRLRFLRDLIGPSRIASIIRQIRSEDDLDGLYIPLVGLRPRFRSLVGCGVPFSGVSLLPPKRRRLPKGMLFAPVEPRLSRHDMFENEKEAKKVLLLKKEKLLLAVEAKGEGRKV